MPVSLAQTRLCRHDGCGQEPSAFPREASTGTPMVRIGVGTIAPKVDDEPVHFIEEVDKCRAEQGGRNCLVVRGR